LTNSERQHQDGDVIFDEAGQSDCAFEIVEGEVEISSVDKQGQVNVARAGAGERFGVDSVLERGVRGATAKAIGAVKLNVLSRAILLQEAKNKTSGDDAARVKSGDDGAAKKAEGVNSALPARTKPAAPPAKANQSQPLDPGGGMVIEGEAEESKPAKPGLFQRLFGFGFSGERLVVRVAPLIIAEGVEKADGMAQAKHVAGILDQLEGLKAKLYIKPVPIEAGADVDFHASDIAGWARAILAKSGGDIMIWGELPAPGTTLYLRFVSSKESKTDQPGEFHAGCALTLPVGFGPEYGQLLAAAVMAVVHPTTPGKALTRLKLFSGYLDAAITFTRALPPDLTTRERAHIHMCTGNALASAGVPQKSADMCQAAAQAYRDALSGLTMEEALLDWGMANKHLGSALQAMAERGGGEEVLEAAIDAYTDALKVLTKLEFPLHWAATQNRLGQVLYRLDRRTGEVEMTKHALSAFQSALQVFTKNETPEPWAEVMSNFAQAAQVLGEQLRNREVLEKAAEASRSALTVRTKDKNPITWAATQNNLGSALFLLGKQMLIDKQPAGERLEQAADAFRKALDVYSGMNAVTLIQITQRNLGRVEELLERLRGKSVPKLRWEAEEAEKEKGVTGKSPPPPFPEAETARE